MSKFIAIKTNEPKLTQKQLSKQLGFSDLSIKQFRDDIQMDSFLIGIKTKETF